MRNRPALSHAVMSACLWFAALPALAQEFNTILGFIEQLNEVDVEGVEPMTSVTPMSFAHW